MKTIAVVKYRSGVSVNFLFPSAEKAKLFRNDALKDKRVAAVGLGDFSPEKVKRKRVAKVKRVAKAKRRPPEPC